MHTTKEIKKELRLIANLKPFINAEGSLTRLWTVGQKQLPLSSTSLHDTPEISPFYTELVICATHRKKQHSGPVITLAAIRETYWIIGSLSTLKHYLHMCTICIRQHTRPVALMMVNLPPGHLTVNQPAFTLMGMDFYSLSAISQGRDCNAIIKVWGLIFTCLSTRAVYSDVVASLSLTYCLNIIKRFLVTYGDKTRCF